MFTLKNNDDLDIRYLRLYGKTVFLQKNPDNSKKIIYYGKNIKKENEELVKYTWDVCMHNGFYAIKINFSKISEELKKSSLVAIETNTPYIIHRKHNKNRGFRLLGCFKRESKNKGRLYDGYKNKSFFYLKDLNLNTDYYIYITVPETYWSFFNEINQKPDWKVKMNVRPAFTVITASDVQTYIKEIPVERFKRVEMLKNEIYTL